MSDLGDQLQDRIDAARGVLEQIEDLAHQLDEQRADPPAPDPGEDPTPDPPAGEGDPLAVLPGLRTWTVALPTGESGDPDNDYLSGSVPGVVFVRDGGVVFRANAGGVTTKNSQYPRAEARQMADDDWTKAAWPSSQPWSLECELAIDTRGLRKRRRISAMQIHDGGDDVCQLIYQAGEGLGIAHDDGESWALIDPDYRDGQRVAVRIAVVPRPGEDYDRVQVFYDAAPQLGADDWTGELVADLPKRGTGWYFKYGAYLQTNVKKWGEAPAATGEVVVWRATLAGPGA